MLVLSSSNLIDSSNKEPKMSKERVDENRNGKQKTTEKKSRSHSKPQYSYISLVTMAILDSPERRRTLGDIIEYIQTKFPFYGQNCPVKGWQNSIRHNLSLNDCFIKTHRDPAKPSRGHFWTLHPGSMDMFEGGSFMRRKKRFSAPESQLRKRPNSSIEKLATASLPLDPRRRKNEAALDSLRDVEETTSHPWNPQSHPDLSLPARTPPLSEMPDYPEPVMSRSLFHTPGWTILGGELSTHLGQPQYLVWSPLQQSPMGSRMAPLGYGCRRCSGCTCDY